MNQPGSGFDRQAAPTIGSDGEQQLARAKRHALRVLPGVTLVFAACCVAVSCVSLYRGEFDALVTLSAIPAVVAGVLAVRGRKARSIPLCVAGLVVLIGWGAVASALNG
ncbi:MULTISPECIES: hypothetical protein [unclassified Streptomyces]|uniref:hypothetical protein n=1 Tax=unclassified Streptomyces TaxID=2593676 RepID=UPI00278C3F0F|nr:MULTISPECIES: hypothetical protein [unclassified Streptomyces]